MSDHTYEPKHDDGAHPHITPPWLLLAVFFGLIALTGITVVSADPALKEILRLWICQQFFPMTPQAMSRASLWLALGIASIKATLVALYFMHLRWDKPMNAIAAVSGFVFAALFIGFLMSDSVWTREDTFHGRVYNDQQQATGVDRVPGQLHDLPGDVEEPAGDADGTDGTHTPDAPEGGSEGDGAGHGDGE